MKTVENAKKMHEKLCIGLVGEICTLIEGEGLARHVEVVKVVEEVFGTGLEGEGDGVEKEGEKVESDLLPSVERFLLEEAAGWNYWRYDREGCFMQA